MSTSILTAALITIGLLHGAEPAANEPKQETAAEAPAPKVEANPVQAGSESKDAEEQTAEGDAQADEPAPESVTRPTEASDRGAKRVAAFWFVSVGK